MENHGGTNRNWRTRVATFGLLAATATLWACDGELTNAPPPPASLAIVGATDYDLNGTTSGDVVVNGAHWSWPADAKVGTGVINPFLKFQDDPFEEAFNTDANPLPLDAKVPTKALPLNHVPTIIVNNMQYREMIFDIHEPESTPQTQQVAIRLFDLWLCDTNAAQTFSTVASFTGNAACTRVYHLDNKIARATGAYSAGSGNGLDYQILIPETLFQAALSGSPNAANCFYQGLSALPCGIWLILNTQMGATAAQVAATPAEADWTSAATPEEISTVERPVQLLTIVKRVVNNHGGTATVANFNPTTNAAAVPLVFGSGVADGANTLKYTSNTLSIPAGTYTLSETGIAGYTEGTWACTNATMNNTGFATGSVTVPEGANVVCTITNDDDPGTLQLRKIVTNDNGGTKTAADFPFTQNTGQALGAAVPSGSAPTITYTYPALTVNAGPYTFSEGDVAGYAEGTWSCTGATATGTAFNAGGVTVPNGGAVVCSITNNDAAATLQLRKIVTNDNGGTKTAADFPFTQNTGQSLGAPGASGSAPTITYTYPALTVNAGPYTFSEGDVAGYTEGTWSCTGASATGTAFNAGGVTVPNGGTVVCTITNNDQQGTLQLVKVVINDNGGTKTAADFPFTQNTGQALGAAVPSGSAPTITYTYPALTVNAGAYTFSEGDVAGYTEGTWSCTGATATGTAFNAGGVTVPNGGAVVCSITNNDALGTLQLRKIVTNDNGGTKTAADFPFTQNTGQALGAAVPSGSAPTITYTYPALSVSAGPYTFSEGDVAGYTEGTWSCTGASATGTAFNAGGVTVPSGGTVVCTITNNDQQGTLQLRKIVTNDNGGTKTVADFPFTQNTGQALGAAVPSGSAPTITYTYPALTVNAGAYTFSEPNVAGYTEGTWSCTGATATGTAFNAGGVTVANGGAVVCTITNNDDPGTIIIRKTVTGGSNGTFTFATTSGPSTALTNPISITTVGGSGQVTFNNRNAGIYTVDENDLAGYTLTDLGCTESGGASAANTTVVGPPSGVATIRLEVGETVTCTYVNSGSLTTRTQGFWGTHMTITQAVWFGGTAGGNSFPGVTDKSLCDGLQARELDTIGKVLGGFWSSIPKTTTNGNRSDLDKARMQLAGQLLAAILNNAAFGSAPGGSISIAQARVAYCGTDIDAIKAAHAAMAAFNESGDGGLFTPGASANGKQSKDAATLVFWDILP